MRFRINGRDIYYCDKVWQDWIRIIPKDEDFFRKLTLSRNKIPKWFIDKFNLSDEDRKEYDSCKTEQELAERIITDCKKKGLIFIDMKKE